MPKDRSLPATLNYKRFHQGVAMNGRTLYKAFLDGLPKKENAKLKSNKKAVSPKHLGRGTCQAITLSAHS